MTQREDIATMLERAEACCAARAAKLTALRRDVLELILRAGQPVGAYTLLDQLKQRRTGAAPPTVYRALDFLLEQGLVHKVERLNAFVACLCGNVHAHCAHGHVHPVQFLICRQCNAVTELDDHDVLHSIEKAAARSGFRPVRATVEVEGICAACAKAAA